MAPRLPIIGTEDSGSNRLWCDIDQDDVVITQRFHPPYSSAPDVITALWIVDIGPGKAAIGIKTTAEDVRSKHFTLRIGVWGDGIMSDNGCNWLAIMPGDTRYRSGEYRINRRSLHADQSLPVTFDPPFEYGRNIKVVALLSGFQMASDKDWHVSVTANEPTHTGFKLTVLAPHATLHQAAIAWFAYDANDPHIRSGSYETTGLISKGNSYGNPVLNTGDAVFSPHFTSIPRVIHGISSLQVENNYICLQLNREPAATREGFPWTCTSWGWTGCEQLGAAYVAICDTA